MIEDNKGFYKRLTELNDLIDHMNQVKYTMEALENNYQIAITHSKGYTDVSSIESLITQSDYIKLKNTLYDALKFELEHTEQLLKRYTITLR